MKKLLVTGATGNVGLAVLGALQKINHDLVVTAGVRDLQKDPASLTAFDALPVKFDFTDVSTYEPALTGCDLLFLLRPPAIADVSKYFEPLIKVAKKTGVAHIVFLSVQGVEGNSMIPHHKIERLIADSNIPFTFLRPAYFMQNFTTTLKAELVKNHRIYLPAGKAKFTLVDVSDVGAVAAQILVAAEKHVQQKYELTSQEQLTFYQMARKLSGRLGVPIIYKSPALLQFFITEKRGGMPGMMIFVMIMLHYFPRFQKEPGVADWVWKITGRQPKTFDEFIDDNKILLLSPSVIHERPQLAKLPA